MKKISITTAVIIGYFILMSSLGIIAAVPGNVQKGAMEKERIRRQITNYVSCPDFITENSEANRVKAIVSVDENGTVAVSEINSANPLLTSYVQNQLQNVKVKSSGQPEKFVLIINFKVD